MIAHNRWLTACFLVVGMIILNSVPAAWADAIELDPDGRTVVAETSRYRIAFRDGMFVSLQNKLTGGNPEELCEETAVDFSYDYNSYYAPGIISGETLKRIYRRWMTASSQVQITKTSASAATITYQGLVDRPQQYLR